MPEKTKEAITKTKQPTNKSFVRVPNDWFNLNEKEETFASKLGSKRFTLWFALQNVSVKMNMSKVIQAQIKKIAFDMKELTGFSKPESVRKLLMDLQSCGLIKCKDLSPTTKPSDLIEIELVEQDYSKGFSQISTDLYYDKINLIGCNGLLLFCFLFKNHNLDFGKSEDACNYSTGFAKVNRDAIARFTGLKSYKLISDTLKLLTKAKHLIKIIPPEQYMSEDSFGNSQTTWSCNKYRVYPKCDIDNKYYISNSD